MSLNTIYNIQEEPEGALYCRLLTAGQDKCRFVVLVIRRTIKMNENGIQALTQLEPYKISSVETDEWPSTKLVDDTATVLTYSYEKASVDLLMGCSDRLYGWQQPDLPEDLCLLRPDGSPWLVTISHENDGYLMLSPEEKASLISSFPDLCISSGK
jgi:hypothetical protein